MRSADAPVYPEPNESSTEVHEECLKDRERTSTPNNSRGIQEDSPESSANRKWQNAWRRKHPITYRNQSWLYRTTRKIHAELMNAFPELPEKRLYRTVMEDLKDAFPGELETRTDCQPRLITAIEPILSLQKTRMLLKSFQIPCDVFFDSVDARRIRVHVNIKFHGFNSRSPEDCAKIFDGLRTLDEFQRSTMKRERQGVPEASTQLRCRRRRVVGELSLLPVGSAIEPRVCNALLKMLRARRRLCSWWVTIKTVS